MIRLRYFLLFVCLPANFAAAQPQNYQDRLIADKPDLYWSFSGENMGEAAVANGAALSPEIVGKPAFATGPVPPQFPLFGKENRALELNGNSYLRYADPGEKSVLDFDAGDELTLEAWVNLPVSLANDQQVYVIGKGRTNRPGLEKENQNYALRLRGMENSARVSFLFRTADSQGKPGEFHRYNSNAGFSSGSGWHHIAATYSFGQGNKIQTYIDGRPVAGSWDMGGPTDRAPVVDNDELWIGSSLGGSRSSSFHGQIDEVALFRRILSAEEIAARYQRVAPPPVDLPLEKLPADAVEVSLHEGLPAEKTWNFETGQPQQTWRQPNFALADLPRKYERGLIADRSVAFLVRLQGKRQLTEGKHEFLLRAKSAARLFVNGKLAAETGFMSSNASGHEAVPELAANADGLFAPAPSHQQAAGSLELPSGEHGFRLEVIVGGKELRPEIGEVCVALAKEGEEYQLLTPSAISPSALDDLAWQAILADQRKLVANLNTKVRRQTASADDDYWRRRHEYARQAAGEAIAVPALPAGYPANNAIDHFLAEKMEQSQQTTTELLNDYAFLRRLVLDTVGVIPTPGEIETFLADDATSRRGRAIDRYLADPRAADHWVAYWQDVLAENPGILKPELNNTGPFRWWIYESFADNKPIDRFADELVMMQGSKYGGGPAGFALATQNDVPMAAKAHVLSRAFLGLDMTCARCHDAPFHPYEQSDLFHLAAMLNRQPITLPKTSTVPTVAGGRTPAVSISLKPGEKLAPRWPLENFAEEPLPENLLADPADPRAMFAAMLTSPHNGRFTEVVVNRLWQRLLGRGLVDPVDDWHNGEASHPRLLKYLARELQTHNYDLRHVARLILNSHAYQREAASGDALKLFAGPARRRMTAEQVVDSLYAASGKEMRAEVLSLDPEGRRPADTFLNLGMPRRAWELTSLSNERDRPALALPVAQGVVDVLSAFGWRDSRPNPVTVRQEDATVLQPLALANGLAAMRATQASDDSRFTALALKAKTPRKLVDQLCLATLSRPATESERKALGALLSEGFDSRVLAGTKPNPPLAPIRTAVSWSNHLSAEATEIKLELERLARRGDPPSAVLREDFRQRLEDAVWCLLNSPEFVFVP